MKTWISFLLLTDSARKAGMDRQECLSYTVLWLIPFQKTGGAAIFQYAAFCLTAMAVEGVAGGGRDPLDFGSAARARLPSAAVHGHEWP